MDTYALALSLPLIGWAAHFGVLAHRLAAARRDPLTGLRTRAGWTALAERAVRRHREAVVLLVDLDDFKQTNDLHGHAAGDAVLTATAARLTAWCGRYGAAGRLGGDEFTAVVRDIRRTPGLAELRRALGESFLHDGRALPVSASVGVCRLAELPVRSLTDALSAADAAMYAAKGSAGRRGPRHLAH
ncbi:GGDEF domain-containing protein [Streptomyces lichenis]|uniref:GGDEF domain-containing protein n=1 Tax=Streptomyces lichenis TaxID=2306967 RepID=A0ABT0I4Y9_9ACTN|nr:GGDEF domain-containing protein [Streptomyces lichenis]MCK8676399.1 GGDEF domain-containing protein [Streptomyces lichenis]